MGSHVGRIVLLGVAAGVPLREGLGGATDLLDERVGEALTVLAWVWVALPVLARVFDALRVLARVLVGVPVLARVFVALPVT